MRRWSVLDGWCFHLLGGRGRGRRLARGGGGEVLGGRWVEGMMWRAGVVGGGCVGSGGGGLAGPTMPRPRFDIVEH